MAKKESNPVDVDATDPTPLEAGDPVEAPALSQMGGTFAERAKARKATEKQVSSDSAENKAVSSRKASKKS